MANEIFNQNNELINPAVEIGFVGSMYKKPELYIEYGRLIKSQYDLGDTSAKFFYDSFEIMYTSYYQEVNQQKVAAFMALSTERNSQYKRFGGWNVISQWMDMCSPDDMKKTYDSLKKYSLLREYARKGFDVSKLLQLKDFETMSAKNISMTVNSLFSHINTNILDNEDSVSLGNQMTKRVCDYCIRPAFGVMMGYPTIDDAFLGLQLGKALFFGFLSNTGKSRMLINLVCHVAFTQNQRVLILSNEMDEETWEKAYLTTIINNEEYWPLHGVSGFHKKEREIILGQYRDDTTGNFIEKKYNHDTGEYTETNEDYLERLNQNSAEYRNVMKVSKWLEEKVNQYIIFKDITEDYSTEAIRFEMRKASMLYGVHYFALDTLKPDTTADVEDWKAFKFMATKLQEFAREVNGCLIANFQLNDNAVVKDPFDLNSTDISSSKGIKTVADYMLMGKRVFKQDYHKYEYYPVSDKEDDGSDAWGEPVPKQLDTKKDYLIMKVEKNRVTGAKPFVLFEINLDLNIWHDVGIAQRKQYSRNGKKGQ